MAGMLLRVGSVVLALCAAAGAVAAPAPGDAAAGASCDRLAAFNDGRAPTAPVKLRDIDAPAAISACGAAADRPGAAPRHHFQLARALLKADRPAEARAAIEEAIARAGHYPAATYVLGQLYHTGTGVAADTDRAHALYNRAYAAGYTDAAVGLIMLYEDPASGHYDPEAAASTRLILGAPATTAR